MIGSARRAAWGCVLGLACAEPETAAREPVPLTATPAVVACAAGERVPLAVHGGDGRALFDFALASDLVALADVDRARGTATVLCAATGATRLVVAAANASLAVPVQVRAAPPGTVRVAVAPSALTMTNGSSAWLQAVVTSTVADASRDVRYVSADTTIVAVDSLTGQLRGTGRGTTSVAAQARADRSAQSTTAVTVVPGATFVASLALLTGPLALVVGDTARVVADVALTAGASPTTSRAPAFAVTDSAVVRIAADGSLRALRAGTTTIVVSAAAAPLIRALVSAVVREPAP